VRTRATDGRRIGRMVAAILGATLALWLLRGDADAQPRGPIFTASVVVKHQETYDSNGIQFFEIRNAQGSALVSIDGGLELAKTLRGLDGRKVRLVIESAELERLER
jgi:hypothetical protein